VVASLENLIWTVRHTLLAGCVTRKFKWAAVLCAILVVSFCTASTGFRVYTDPSGDDWPMFHHDLAHTGYSTSSALTTTPVVLWTAQKGLGGSPVVADDYVYIFDQISLHCINTSDGHEIWKQRLAFELGSDSSPAVYKSYVYTPLSSYNASTGKLALDYTDYKGFTSPAVAEDMIYIGSFVSHSLFALNATTGNKIWSYITGADVTSSPAVAYGRVYFTSHDGNVYALNASTGTQIWNATGGSSSSPSVGSGAVYIGDSYMILAFNASTGTKIWNYTFPPIDFYMPSSPAISGGVVYAGNGHALYAFSTTAPTPVPTPSPSTPFNIPPSTLIVITIVAVFVTCTVLFLAYKILRKKHENFNIPPPS
jgi:outer membrane protein assembly factor BamB